ncbi:MAG: hypothetical protein ACPG31_14010 [Planctomycetota bacterium]
MLASNGRLGGFTGGLPLKVALLEVEGRLYEAPEGAEEELFGGLHFSLAAADPR